VMGTIIKSELRGLNLFGISEILGIDSQSYYEIWVDRGLGKTRLNTFLDLKSAEDVFAGLVGENNS
jgi:hypothetical protein